MKIHETNMIKIAIERVRLELLNAKTIRDQTFALERLNMLKQCLIHCLETRLQHTTYLMYH